MAYCEIKWYYHS